jgi:hypothetical protein
MHFRQDVVMAVRHHRIGRLTGADFLAADDERDLDRPGRELAQRALQLVALWGAGRERLYELILRDGDLGHGGNLNALSVISLQLSALIAES